MPRRPRLVVPGYPHHIILRGNNRSAVFYKDKDRRFFIACLKDSKERTKSKIYAYCLMTNHIHLLVEPSTEQGLANMMQSLGRKYVQYVNQMHRRTGTLWEGRFKSSLISKDEYLLACSRYIELNPVRAKIVETPGDYSWSSFGFKVEGRPDVLLEQDPVYLELGKTQTERQSNYKRWFFSTVPDDQVKFIRSMTQKGGIIGNKDFIDKIASLLNRDVIIQARGRPRKSL